MFIEGEKVSTFPTSIPAAVIQLPPLSFQFGWSTTQASLVTFYAWKWSSILKAKPKKCLESSKVSQGHEDHADHMYSKWKYYFKVAIGNWLFKHLNDPEKISEMWVKLQKRNCEWRQYQQSCIVPLTLQVITFSSFGTIIYAKQCRKYK